VPSGLRDSGWEILTVGIKVKKEKWKVSEDDRDCAMLDNFLLRYFVFSLFFLHVDVYFFVCQMRF